MLVVGTYGQGGYSIEVFDDVGFQLEYEEFGNMEYNSTLVCPPDDPEALPIKTLLEYCERSATEKAYLLGLTRSAVSLQFDPKT